MIESDKVLGKVVVYDVQGRVVLAASGDIKSIDTSALTQSPYILELYSEGKVLQKKFIKN